MTIEAKPFAHRGLGALATSVPGLYLHYVTAIAGRSAVRERLDGPATAALDVLRDVSPPR
jgi:hypothetical protein